MKLILSIEDVWVIPLLGDEKITIYFKLNMVVIFTPLKNESEIVSTAGWPLF